MRVPRVQSTPKASVVSTAMEKQYLAALGNPFCAQAEGSRVPDMYPFPTATYRIKGTVPLIADSGGNFLALLLPTLSGSFILNAGTLGGGGTGLLQNSSGNSPPYWSVTNNSSVAAQCSAYRVVSAAWRIKNQLNFSTVTGRIYTAPFTTGKKQLPPEVVVNSPVVINASTIFQLLLGNTNPAIMNYLGAKEYTMDELIEDDLTLVSRPIDPIGLAFRESQYFTVLNGNYFLGENDTTVVNGLLGTTTVTQGSDQAKSEGFNSWILSCNGLPISSQFAELEWIFHVEAQPNAASGGAFVGATMVPSNQYVSKVGTNITNLLSTASKMYLQGLIGAEAADVAVELVKSTGARMLSGIAHGR